MSVNRQKEWGVLVVLEFLLSGMAAGAYLVATVPWLFGQPNPSVLRIAGLTVGPLIIVGLILLVADLGSLRNLWRSCSCLASSWMARGTLLLSGFAVLVLIHLAFEAGLFGPGALPPRPLVMVASILAVLVMAYPAVLMAQAKGVRLWSNPAVIGLFSVSAIASGAGWLTLVLGLIARNSDRDPYTFLMYVVMTALALQVGMLFLLMSLPGATAGTTVSRDMLQGQLRLPFWLGVVGVGIAIPVALASWAGVPQAVLTGLCLVVGSFFVRHVIVTGGTYEDTAGLWNIDPQETGAR